MRSWASRFLANFLGIVFFETAVGLLGAVAFGVPMADLVPPDPPYLFILTIILTIIASAVIAHIDFI